MMLEGRKIKQKKKNKSWETYWSSVSTCPISLKRSRQNNFNYILEEH